MLKTIRTDVAGIDLGSRKVFVSVEGDEVRSFETYTDQMMALCQYLQERKIKSVAMEATGVYWIVLYDLLEAAKIEVYVVNAAHVKHVPGRKSDVLDCQWIRQLHSCGLLRASFVPTEDIRALRTYRRIREDHIQMGGDHVRHIQKSMDIMNIKLHTVISQIHGVSGLKVIDAILEGERDAQKLAELCNGQILKCKKDKVIQSLQGNWKEEQLFALRQAREGWEFYQQKIKQCDAQIQELLQRLGEQQPPIEPPSVTGKPKTVRHNAFQVENLHEKLMLLTQGKDPTIIPGLTDNSLLQLIAEVGLDMTKWPTSGHFTSWLGLAPTIHQSGNTFKKRRFKKKTQAGQIFRVVAQSVGQSKYLALGGFYRRIKARSGAMVANVATARKLAVLFYNTLRHGLNFVEEGLKKYEDTYQQRIISNLKKKASVFGYNLIPATSQA